MRKFLLLIVIALLLAVAAYSGIGSESYFLLRIGDWAMQMTLFVALLLAVVILVIVRVCWGVIRGIFFGAWPAAWRNRRQQNLTREALENLALANWAVARKDLVRLANQTEHPMPLVMLSAHASEAMGDYEEAKTVYQQALEEFPDWSYVIRLRLCDIALAQGEIELAETYLAELSRDRGNDAQLQILNARLAEEKRDWKSLQKVLLVLQKKPLQHARVIDIERRYLRNRLIERPGAPDLLEMADYVQALEKVSPDIVAQLAKQLAMRAHGKEAEALVRKVLNKHWDDSLMEAYADLEAQSPKKQLKTAEGWLVDHENSEALIDGLQKLALRAGDDVKVDLYADKLDKLSGYSQVPAQLEN